MICLCITEGTTESALELLRRYRPLIDIAELRLDLMERCRLDVVLRNSPCPVIVTNRPRREGGAFEGDERERIARLREAIELGAPYVDIEYDSLSRLGARRRTRLIVSYHNFEGVPPDLLSIYRELVEAGADVAKVAVMARDVTDNLSVFELLRAKQVPTIAHCMGEDGVVSRVLGKKFGCFLTYTALRGKESAPGQLTPEEIVELYRWKDIGEKTETYGVIGNPVAHSMSPAIHNAAFSAIRYDAVYVPFRVVSLRNFIESYRKIDVRGYSVTIPHKEEAVKCVDKVDELVRKIGALNTIVFRDGGARSYGYNTDSSSATSSIEEALGEPLEGKEVALVGAGGAGRAIAFGLIWKGAKLRVFNRTPEKAHRLAEELGAEGYSLREIGNHSFEILVNATSVGMYPNVDEMPVEGEIVGRAKLVFDAVYNPEETRLILEAKRRGIRYVTGFEMFVRQAVQQFELWTGQKAPVDVMQGVLAEKLCSKQ